jgi:hypothetical protein
VGFQDECSILTSLARNTANMGHVSLFLAGKVTPCHVKREIKTLNHTGKEAGSITRGFSALR